MAQTKRYVDVNVFVYWLGNNPTFGETAHKWINEIENSPSGGYVTSSLSLYEALVSLAGLANKTERLRICSKYNQSIKRN
jgi:uncharacterized protein